MQSFRQYVAAFTVRCELVIADIFFCVSSSCMLLHGHNIIAGFWTLASASVVHVSTSSADSVSIPVSITRLLSVGVVVGVVSTSIPIG